MIAAPKGMDAGQLSHATMLAEHPVRSIKGTYIFSGQFIVVVRATQDIVDANWVKRYPTLQQKRQLLTAM
jgi:hypothetical protein